jgi:hypothetical protein
MSKYDFSTVENDQLQSMLANLGESASPFKDALLSASDLP